MVAVSLKKFFFQAEDGIRDVAPSRGLGDVYKRQAQYYRATIKTKLTRSKLTGYYVTIATFTLLFLMLRFCGMFLGIRAGAVVGLRPLHGYQTQNRTTQGGSAVR